VKAYRHIQTLGPRILVVKRGEYGVSLFTPQGYYLTPAFPLEEVIDPTGAGDTFAGGFLGALAASGNLDMTTLKHAVVTGTVMASFTVEAFGTERLQTLTSKQIQERIEIFSNMIRLTNH
jgi:sugar/nucleoside kinase (ribokinase family)